MSASLLPADPYLQEDALKHAEAMRAAMGAVDAAWAAYEKVVGSPDVAARDAARTVWQDAINQRNDAQHTAAFMLGYLMLGRDWYANLRGFPSQSAFVDAICVKARS